MVFHAGAAGDAIFGALGAAYAGIAQPETGAGGWSDLRAAAIPACCGAGIIGPPPDAPLSPHATAAPGTLAAQAPENGRGEHLAETDQLFTLAAAGAQTGGGS